MLNAYDCTSILAYKIMKDNDIFKKTEFTKDELSDFFEKVIKKADENFDSDKKDVIEIKQRLEFFSKVERGLVLLDKSEFKAKYRKRASMYVQGMDCVLQCCCIKTYAEELKLKNESSHSL